MLISGAVGLVINLAGRAEAVPGLPWLKLGEGNGIGVSSMAIMLGSWVLALLIGGIVSNMQIEARGLRTASFVVPAVGVALMLPLFLHALFFLDDGATQSFDSWVGWALIATAVAHVTTAVLMAVRAWQLAKGKKPLSVGAVYGFGVLASVFPLGMFLVPEILTAITGLAFLPVLYLQATLARHDRDDELDEPRDAATNEIAEAIAQFRMAA